MAKLIMTEALRLVFWFAFRPIQSLDFNYNAIVRNMAPKAQIVKEKYVNYL